MAKAPKGKPAKKTGTTREDRGKRLLDLVVMLLGARTAVSFHEIRAQFNAYRTQNEEAGLRAFERDKSELLELGVPLRYVTPDEDDSFDEAGYIIDFRRYRLPEIQLSADEVAALMLAGSMARAASGTTYSQVVDLALRKLAFDRPRSPDAPGTGTMADLAGRDKSKEPVLVVFPSAADEAKLSERLATFEQAIRHRKKVTLTYTSASQGEQQTRDVFPYGIAYRQGSWLLVGHCLLRDDVRSFRLDRVIDYKVAPKPKTADFERLADFDLRRYVDRSPWTFATAEPVPVELTIFPTAAAIGNEDFGEGSQFDKQDDGSVRVRFSCKNPDYLVSRVLSAKGAIRVNSPESIQALVTEELDAVCALYK